MLNTHYVPWALEEIGILNTTMPPKSMGSSLFFRLVLYSSNQQKLHNRRVRQISKNNNTIM